MKLEITNLIGANTTESQKKAAFEVGAKGRTTDGKLCQYVKCADADIAADIGVEFDGDGNVVESSGAAIGQTAYPLKANEFGFIVLS